MKTCSPSRAGWLSALLAITALAAAALVLQAATTAPAKPATNQTASATTAAAAPVPFEPPKSVFIWDPADPAFGRDPFFPHSSRNGRWAPPPPRKEVKQVETATTTTTTPPKPVETPAPPASRKEYKMDLNGIGGRRTAVINNISFLKGETGRVNTPDGPVKIRLDEILGDGVRITIWLEDGKTETREIPLSGR
ncbi:MAG: hypothetical protein N3J91_02600 [Verrucomicrobiae bacterium]|nr:hypothetical protein [Verrucomicrobiae bacterium]